MQNIEIDLKKAKNSEFKNIVYEYKKHEDFEGIYTVAAHNYATDENTIFYVFINPEDEDIIDKIINNQLNYLIRKGKF